jgi:hypothetical protein
VHKTSKPIIQLAGNDTIYLFTGQTWTELGVNFNDAYYTSNVLQSLLKTGGTFSNPAIAAGNYFKWYHVTDPSGNKSDTVFRYFVISVNGVSTPVQQQISLYPNPTSAFIYLSGQINTGDVLYITDMNGRVLGRPEAYVGKGISVSHLAPGLYILNVEGRDTRQAIKFEISR